MKKRIGIFLVSSMLLAGCNATMGTSASMGGRDGGVRVDTATNSKGETRTRVGANAVLKRWSRGAIRVGGSATN